MITTALAARGAQARSRGSPTSTRAVPAAGRAGRRPRTRRARRSSCRRARRSSPPRPLEAGGDLDAETAAWASARLTPTPLAPEPRPDAGADAGRCRRGSRSAPAPPRAIPAGRPGRGWTPTGTPYDVVDAGHDAPLTAPDGGRACRGGLMEGTWHDQRSRLAGPLLRGLRGRRDLPAPAGPHPQRGRQHLVHVDDDEHQPDALQRRVRRALGVQEAAGGLHADRRDRGRPERHRPDPERVRQPRAGTTSR